MTKEEIIKRLETDEPKAKGHEPKKWQMKKSYIRVNVSHIVWDCPTSVSITLPHEKTLSLDCGYLEDRGVFKVSKPGLIGKTDGFNEVMFGSTLMHLLISETGRAIKQIKYRVIDWGDYPPPF